MTLHRYSCRHYYSLNNKCDDLPVSTTFRKNRTSLAFDNVYEAQLNSVKIEANSKNSGTKKLPDMLSPFVEHLLESIQKIKIISVYPRFPLNYGREGELDMERRPPGWLLTLYWVTIYYLPCMR